MIKNIFDAQVANEVIERINQLTPSHERLWGTMTVDQMLAHCNIPYSYTYEPEKFKKPGSVKKFLLKNFVKKYIVSETPYKQNGRTAPEFIITGKKDFEKEKATLIENILKTQKLGEQDFEGKENFSFGKMTAKEWNTMYYKHLDHHLRQFGV